MGGENPRVDRRGAKRDAAAGRHRANRARPTIRVLLSRRRRRDRGAASPRQRLDLCAGGTRRAERARPATRRCRAARPGVRLRAERAARARAAFSAAGPADPRRPRAAAEIFQKRGVGDPARRRVPRVERRRPHGHAPGWPAAAASARLGHRLRRDRHRLHSGARLGAADRASRRSPDDRRLPKNRHRDFRRFAAARQVPSRRSIAFRFGRARKPPKKCAGKRNANSRSLLAALEPAPSEIELDIGSLYGENLISGVTTGFE